MRLLRQRAARRDERGAVLILAAVFAAVAIVGAALSIDIGALVLEKRSNQRVADLASLDGVRGLSGADKRQTAEQLVVESARRNGFETTWVAGQCSALQPGNTGATFVGSDARELIVEIGNATSSSAFVPLPCPVAGYAAEQLLFDTGLLPAPNAVRVTASSPVGFKFMPGSQVETASAVSVLDVATSTNTTPDVTTPGSNAAAVNVGSTAVGISATHAALLNTIFQVTGNPVGPPLGNPPGNLNITALGYQGLANVTMSLEELATELGISAGTVDDVLSADFGYDDLLRATALIADRNNQDEVAVTITEIEDRTIPLDYDARHQDIDFGGLIEGVTGGAETFNGSSVAQTELNVLELLQSATYLADGDHLLTIPLTGTVPLPTGATVASVNVTMIEAAQQSGYGPAQQVAKTAQLSATLVLQVPVAITGLGVVNIDLPVDIQGGQAIATITDIPCQAAATVPDHVRVEAVTQALASNTGGWSTSALDGLVTISANPGPVVSSPGSTGAWNVPPDFTAVYSVPTAPLATPTVSPSAITVGGVLPIGVTAGAVATTIVDTLNPVLAQLNSTVMPVLYQSLGVGFSSADVTVEDLTSATPPACVPGTFTPGTTTTVSNYGVLPILTE